MVRKYKNYIYFFAVLAFIVMSTGLTYSYFVYNKEVVVADLTAGSIGIDFVGESQTIQGTNITTLTDGEGKVSGGYLDFQVEAIADTEEILYEVEIVQSGLTSSQLDNIKVYLTDQNDTEILGVYTYNELFDSGIYYLGTSGYNYKLSVCANTTSGNTKVCDKTSEVGTFNIGLPRYGEMFATQQSGGYSNSIDMWLMNRYSASYVRSVDRYGYSANDNPTDTYGGRPTLHLKSTVKILSGSGTELDPYVVGL